MVREDSGLRLSDREKAFLQGEAGEPRRWAIQQQLAVGAFFDARDFVDVTQVHLCADTEALGESGVEFVEGIARAGNAGRVCVPSITDPRGSDVSKYRTINQAGQIVALEKRLADALTSIGFLMTNTCINYQYVLPPVRGEYLAFGDSGSVIYANSVCGAYSNYEGGPAALAAALTGCVPRYGFHLSDARRGSCLYRIDAELQNDSDWGAVGGFIGREMQSYWDVPVIISCGRPPRSDELKHLGAALASFGSTAMFHYVGVTPEAPTLEAAFGGSPPGAAQRISANELNQFYAGFTTSKSELDVVVFAAPQLSLFEVGELAGLMSGNLIHNNTMLLVAVPPAVKAMADNNGLTDEIERAGGVILEGVCFYQMHARELASANGWKTLMTNSAKLANIVTGYGYEPVLASMRQCVDAAIAGRVPA